MKYTGFHIHQRPQIVAENENKIKREDKGLAQQRLTSIASHWQFTVYHDVQLQAELRRNFICPKTRSDASACQPACHNPRNKQTNKKL